MALYTSLTGITTAQTDLSVVSNNIANANSVGFKRARAEFSDIVATSPLQNPGTVYGAGATLRAISQQFTQGSIQSSLNALDLALTGQGFFTVRADDGTGDILFTRNGSFSTDAQGMIIDAKGRHLQAYPVNQNGVITATGAGALQSLRVPERAGPAIATTAIDITATLSADADVIPASARFTATTPYAFNRLDPTTYNSSASTTAYDAEGNALPATIYYVRTAAATATSPTESWDAYVSIGNEMATSTPIALSFDSSGAMIAPAGAVALDPVTPPSGAAPITATLRPGLATSVAPQPFTLLALTQNGMTPGRLDSVSVDVEGLVSASYSNGDTLALGRLAVAGFANPQGLKQVGDAHYALTGISGAAQFSAAGADGLGNILSGALERSNVDLTEELVNMMTAQRNFQANARAIETDNTMAQAILNIR